MEKAASQKDAKAQYHLGVYYHKEIGVNADINEAIKYYKAAASQKYAPAEEALKILEEEEMQKKDTKKEAELPKNKND